MSKVCKKHRDNPVLIYNQCVGCELEEMSKEIQILKQRRNYETEKENRWISVKDRLPEEEGKYLICCSDGYQTTAEYENKTWLVYTGRYEEIEDVTHWMPLPEPPKGDDDE